MDSLIESREQELRSFIESELPDFSSACKQTEAEDLILHQDAFAADYQDAEYVLLGKVVKYAGLHGKTIRFIGTNRATL